MASHSDRNSSGWRRVILQSRIWKGGPVLLDFLKQIIFRGKPAKRVCHLTHSISGKVELVDQWSINLSFSFLNLLDSLSLFLCPCLVPSLCSLLPLVSFKILFVYSDPGKKTRVVIIVECFSSNCCRYWLKIKPA